MSRATVFVEDSFDSAHWLPNVPHGHKCSRPHGHTYRIRIEVTGSIGTQSGWVVDYTYVKNQWLEIKEQLDHRQLNDVPGLENPTCELLSLWIAVRLKASIGELTAIEIRETEHCGVRVEG